MGSEVPVIIILLAIPTYFISKWIMIKVDLGTEKNRKYVALIPTVILSPIIYVCIIIIWIWSISYYPKSSFDQSKWNSNIEERYKMSDDIIKSEILLGKTRESVIKLLGENLSSSDPNTFYYGLGHTPGMFNIDPDYLEVIFEDSIVIRVIQRQG